MFIRFWIPGGTAHVNLDLVTRMETWKQGDGLSYTLVFHFSGSDPLTVPDLPESTVIDVDLQLRSPRENGIDYYRLADAIERGVSRAKRNTP